MEDLLEYLRRPEPEPFKFERVGDGVQGVVVDIEVRTSRHQPDGFPVVIVRREDGSEVAVACAASVLRDEVVSRDPQPGDRFAALYKGNKTSRSGDDYKHFVVAVRRGIDDRPVTARLRAAEPEQDKAPERPTDRRERPPQNGPQDRPAERRERPQQGRPQSRSAAHREPPMDPWDDEPPF
jgi:hypothetical protein